MTQGDWCQLAETRVFFIKERVKQHEFSSKNKENERTCYFSRYFLAILFPWARLGLTE
jgi:hypothetical protein